LTRRDWWLGIGTVVAAILFHALMPRYEWRNIGPLPVVRVDRWTGAAIRGHFEAGRWMASPPGTSEPVPASVVDSPPLKSGR